MHLQYASVVCIVFYNYCSNINWDASNADSRAFARKRRNFHGNVHVDAENKRTWQLKTKELQRDIDTAVEWAPPWQMQFNTIVCKIMHVGHRKERAIYNMDKPTLEDVEEEKYLGVLIHRKLSVSNNCAVAVNKAIQNGRTNLQNCDTQERTNCCTTVQKTGEITFGVLLTRLVTLSKEWQSKYW